MTIEVMTDGMSEDPVETVTGTKEPDELQTTFVKVLDFEEAFRKEPEKPTVKEWLKNWSSKKCTRKNLRKTLNRYFPFIKLLRSYKLKTDLPSDLIAGITVGIMMIPQGMAFGELSTLTPVVGLYISLFAPLSYFFFGTGRQSSLGCIAVLSLMMATILEKYDAAAGLNSVGPKPIDPVTNCAVEYTQDIMDKRIEVAGAVTLAVGLVTMAGGVLGLGFVINFMSNALITSFTVGISIHVLTSQIRNVFGLKYGNYNSGNQSENILPEPTISYSLTNITGVCELGGLSKYEVLTKFSGAFKIVKTWVDILGNIASTNPATVIVSLICMIIIYLIKAQVNERFKAKLRVPIPIELIVVIFGTLSSFYIGLQKEYNVPVVGNIPSGVPVPRIPNLMLAKDYFFDGLIIIIVAYAQTISMAKTLGIKNNYKVDANQEMFATGSACAVCGIFSGYITAASVSRSLVQDGAGGKTQVTSIVACSVVLLVIMVVGPYLHALPLCVLSSIIIVNLRGMFMKLFDLRQLWLKSRYDCIVWVATFGATVLIDTDMGLMIGFLVCILMVVVRTQRSTTVTVGTVSTTEEFRSTARYKEVRQWEGICIVRIDSPLYFANAEIFKNRVYKMTGINPLKLKRKRFGLTLKVVNTKEVNSNNIKNSVNRSDGPRVKGDDAGVEPSVFLLPDQRSTLPHHIILNMTGVSFLDLMGVAALEQIISEFRDVDIQVLLTEVRENNLDLLGSTGFLKKNGELLFLTCEDALREAGRSNQEETDNSKQVTEL